MGKSGREDRAVPAAGAGTGAEAALPPDIDVAPFGDLRLSQLPAVDEQRITADGRGAVIVVLPSSPSTGYCWYLVRSEGGVAEIYASFQSNAGEEELVGGAGHQRFDVGLSGHLGERRLEFRCDRVWVTGDDPLARTFTLVIDVVRPS